MAAVGPGLRRESGKVWSTNSSPHGRETTEFEGKVFERGFGDRLGQGQWRQLQTATFYGNDVDAKWSASPR